MIARCVAASIAMSVIALGFGFSQAKAQASGQAASPVSAFDRYRLAAAKGDAAALNGLGGMYQVGDGVALDLVKAYALFHLAASLPNGDPGQRSRAAGSRDALAGKMSADQLAQAQSLFALCYGNDINLCGERIISSGGGPQVAPTQQGLSVSVAGKTIVPLENQNGTYVVPAMVNGTLTLKFTVDTGATFVSMPANIVANLMQTGSITKDDVLGEGTYKLADGSSGRSQIVRIRSLKLGDVVIENVEVSVLPERSSLLLGQSFFGRLKSWSLDNARHELIIQ